MSPGMTGVHPERKPDARRDDNQYDVYTYAQAEIVYLSLPVPSVPLLRSRIR